MKQKYKEALMDMAERFGQTSTAERLKVGCLIYKDGIIAEGVNGMPPGWYTEECEDRNYTGEYQNSLPLYDLVTKPECRHAEIAALEKIWGKHETTLGASIFVSHSPCLPCSIKIKTAGITTVYYRHEYRSDAGLNYLRAVGILVEQIK